MTSRSVGICVVSAHFWVSRRSCLREWAQRHRAGTAWTRPSESKGDPANQRQWNFNASIQPAFSIGLESNAWCGAARRTGTVSGTCASVSIFQRLLTRHIAETVPRTVVRDNLNSHILQTAVARVIRKPLPGNPLVLVRTNQCGHLTGLSTAAKCQSASAPQMALAAYHPNGH
jgi:hypothetical protein